MTDSATIDLVRAAASKRVLILPHAARQMARPDRVIWSDDILDVIAKGVVIEDYPDDVRGHSCLLLGFGHGGRPIHVVCAPKEEYLAVITAYVPEPGRWAAGFATRRPE